MMTEFLVNNSVFWLNSFPNKDGISQDISPLGIIDGFGKIDYNSIRISFGSYAEVYITTTNTNRPRTVGGIALSPSNEYGGYYFMSLETGTKLHATQWTELPIPTHIITRVEYIARRQKQPKTPPAPVFEWAPGVPMDDDDVYDEEQSWNPEDDALSI